MGCGRPEGGIKSQIADAIAFGQSRLNVTPSLAFGFGNRSATRLLASQAIKLGVKTPGSEFLPGADLLPPFPPLPVLGC
jgi:hypothetical protein